MGTVFEAWDERLRRNVAIKRILPEAAGDDRSRRRLLREGRAAASLNHPSIVQIFDIFEEQGVDWIVMELVEGSLLTDLIDGGRLGLAEAVVLAREIAEGLAEAHDKGIIHRDLKTENVMVTRSHHAKILDFGLAKSMWLGPGDTDVSGFGAVLGTGRAMSPEQAMGEEVDHRSDLFSLGTLIFETVTGRPPFDGATTFQTLAQVCSTRQTPARALNRRVPVELSNLIDRLLEKNPVHRPQSAREVVVELRVIGRLPLPEWGGAYSWQGLSDPPEAEAGWVDDPTPSLEEIEAASGSAPAARRADAEPLEPHLDAAPPDPGSRPARPISAPGPSGTGPSGAEPSGTGPSGTGPSSPDAPESSTPEASTREPSGVAPARAAAASADAAPPGVRREETAELPVYGGHVLQGDGDGDSDGDTSTVLPVPAGFSSEFSSDFVPETYLKTLLVLRVDPRSSEARRDEMTRRMRREVVEIDGRELADDVLSACVERPSVALQLGADLLTLADELGVGVSVAIHVGEIFLHRTSSGGLEARGSTRTVCEELAAVAPRQQLLMTPEAFRLAHRAVVDFPGEAPRLVWQSHGRWFLQALEETVELWGAAWTRDAATHPPTQTDAVYRLADPVPLGT